VMDADQVTVKMNDRREYQAKVIGIDQRTDVALIKIEGKNLPVVRIGDPSKLKPGEWVLAIGSPFGFENSATAGIVSATSRSLPNEGNNYVPFIQTDVAVNPGNSGGPLFNLAGEVIGINSQIFSRTGGYMGLSFAIPIDVAMDVREQADRQGLYVETFLAAVYPVGAGRVIVIVPTEDVALPTAGQHASIDALLPNLPPQSIVLVEDELPRGSRKGSAQTYAQVMSMWERLAAPFLAAAEQSKDAIAKAVGFRQTIRVDYACELAHQHLSGLAREMDRERREKRG